MLLLGLRLLLRLQPVGVQLQVQRLALQLQATALHCKVVAAAAIATAPPSSMSFIWRRIQVGARGVQERRARATPDEGAGRREGRGVRAMGLRAAPVRLPRAAVVVVVAAMQSMEAAAVSQGCAVTSIAAAAATATTTDTCITVAVDARPRCARRGSDNSYSEAPSQ